MNRNVLNNIWKLYVVEIAYKALFFNSVLIVFLQETGLSLKEVFLLQGLAAFVLMILEIPSGYLSDRWGRKNTLLIGSLFGCMSMVLYSMSTTFWGFFVAEVLLAILISFHSGTIEAMAYDSLLEVGKEEDYGRVVGQQQFFGFSALAISSLIGGLLATITFRTPLWATIIPFGLGLVFVLFLQEPTRHKLQERQHFKAIKSIVRDAIIKNTPLRSLILLTAMISAMVMGLVWFTQPYEKLVGLPIALFGVVHAGMMMAAGLVSWYADRVKKQFDNRTILIILTVVVIASYLILGFVVSLWGIIFLTLGRIVFGLLMPITSDMINRVTTSETRATILSIRSFLTSLIVAILSPLFGYWADVFTLPQAMLLIGLITIPVTIGMFLFMNRTCQYLPK